MHTGFGMQQPAPVSGQGEYTDSDGDGIPDKAPESDEVAAEDDNLMLYLGGGMELQYWYSLLFFVLRGGKEGDIIDSSMGDDFGATAADTLVLLRWIQWSNTSNN